MQIDDKIRTIIAEQLGAPESSLTYDAKFVESLGADSLDVVELIMALEENFEIEIPDEEAQKIETVGDAINFISRKLSSQVPT